MNSSEQRPHQPTSEGVDCRPTFTEAAEEAIYDYCEQLHRTHSADESTLQRLLSLVGNKAAIEITGLCGYYTMVAMTLNAFGIGTDAAPKPLAQRRDGR